jgi:hypothetical protein
LPQRPIQSIVSTAHSCPLTLEQDILCEVDRLARECAKLDPKSEQALAEEGISAEVGAWPEYRHRRTGPDRDEDPRRHLRQRQDRQTGSREIETRMRRGASAIRCNGRLLYRL